MVRRPIVLNTRPAGEQADELSTLMRASGFEPFELPLTEIVPDWDATVVRAVAEELSGGAYEWVVFPSANAARCLLEALGANPFLVSLSNHGSRVLCGPGTAAALNERGVIADAVLPSFSARAALERLLHENACSVLVPRARDGRLELIDGLRAAGVRVDDLVVYRTRALVSARLGEAAELLRQGRVAGVALASPTAVKALASGLRQLGMDPPALLRGTALACIGETTARAVAESGIGQPTVAQGTSMESLVEALSAATRHPVAP